MDMRRKDRLLQDQEAWDILQQGLYGVLATVDHESQAHGTPLSYYADQENGCIYFHCTKTGQKIENLDHNPKVCFTVVKEAKPIFTHDPVGYSMYYTSTMAYGRAQRLNGDEKKSAVMTLVAKYFSENTKPAEGYYDQLGNFIDVWKITIDRLTAKAHQRKG